MKIIYECMLTDDTKTDEKSMSRVIKFGARYCSSRTEVGVSMSLTCVQRDGNWSNQHLHLAIFSEASGPSNGLPGMPKISALNNNKQKKKYLQFSVAYVIVLFMLSHIILKKSDKTIVYLQSAYISHCESNTLAILSSLFSPVDSGLSSSGNKGFKRYAECHVVIKV